jgi:imidazolonepropionase-like amidohydrolase
MTRHLVHALALLLVAVSAVQAQTRAFTGATLIDGTDRSPVRNATIVVRDGKVVAAGAGVAVPAGAERVPLDGKFVMPGLVNSHGHVNGVADLSTYAAYGVTSVYSLGGEPEAVIAARGAQGSPTLNRTRVWVSGPVLTPRNVEEAKAQVAGIAAIRADMVKIRVDDNLRTATKMTPEVYKAVISEAHRLGLRVAVHLYYLDDAKAIVASGGDFVAHSVRDGEVDDAFISAMKRSGICYTPTLMREVSTFVYESTPEWFSDPLFIAHANPEWIAQGKDPARQQTVRNSASAKVYKAALPVAQQNMKKLLDAGVPIAMGTDTGPQGRFQGYFELMELELMAQAGLTPKQVLHAATREAAKCMKIDGQVGTLEAGKWADFIALDANPLENVSNVRKISSVWIAGNRVAR